MKFKPWPTSTFSSWNIPATRTAPVHPAKRVCSTRRRKRFTRCPAVRPVYLVGESLGSGVASYLAGTYSNQIAGLILISPFSSLTDVAQHHFPLLPVRWFLVDRFPFANVSPELSGQTGRNGGWQRHSRSEKIRFRFLRTAQNFAFCPRRTLPNPRAIGGILEGSRRILAE